MVEYADTDMRAFIFMLVCVMDMILAVVAGLVMLESLDYDWEICGCYFVE